MNQAAGRDALKQSFAAMILGCTGQVGGAAAAELLASECWEVMMVTGKPIATRSRARNVVLDTGAADFAARTAAIACEVLSHGSLSAVSCVGVGSGSMCWSEEELQRLARWQSGTWRAMAEASHAFNIQANDDRLIDSRSSAFEWQLEFAFWVK